jgi:hypothetical protein
MVMTTYIPLFLYLPVRLTTAVREQATADKGQLEADKEALLGGLAVRQLAAGVKASKLVCAHDVMGTHHCLFAQPGPLHCGCGGVIGAVGRYVG